MDRRKVRNASCVVDENTRALLVAIERVTCANPACRGFRRAGTRTCNRCLQGTDVRPPRIGDIIPGPASAYGHTSDQPAVDASAPSTVPEHTASAFEALALPGDFSRRVRKLPCHTLLHIPISCRVRVLNIMENTLQGISAGSNTHALAEEGRSKLLLGAVPEGTSAADEVSARLRLWESGSFEALLRRADQQVIVSRRLRARGPSARLADSDRKAKKAKRVAAEGAYAKATSGLVSDMMSFDATDDLKYANDLLPRSSDPSSAFSSQVHVPPPDSPASADSNASSFRDRGQDSSPLKGVKLFIGCPRSQRRPTRAHPRSYVCSTTRRRQPPASGALSLSKIHRQVCSLRRC